MVHPGVVLVTGNLVGPSDYCLSWFEQINYFNIVDVCIDICVMMSSDLYSVDVIVMSCTNSNLPYRTRPAWM